jgi:hypothetical protein
MNVDVLQGAIIALVSIGGGAGLQSYLSERRERKDRRIQFEQDRLLDLQAALGDMAVSAEQIRFVKRAAGSWNDDQVGLPWADLLKHAIQAGRDRVLIDDTELQELASEAERAYFRVAEAASEAEAHTELARARELLRQANAHIGQRVRGL